MSGHQEPAWRKASHAKTTEAQLATAAMQALVANSQKRHSSRRRRRRIGCDLVPAYSRIPKPDQRPVLALRVVVKSRN
jgi:hypothetical protein